MSPAQQSSKVATIVELSDTMRSCKDRGRSSNRRHGRPSRVHNQPHDLDVTEVDNYEDDYLYTVDTGKIKNSNPMFLVQLHEVPTKMLGDSGATVNVIDEPTLETQLHQNQTCNHQT